MSDWAGLAISGYRSFASGAFEVLSPFTDVVLLAGANNSGKSNALRFVQVVLGAGVQNGQGPTLAALDRPSGAPSDARTEFAIGLRLDAMDITGLTGAGQPLDGPVAAAVIHALSTASFRLTADEGIAWFRYFLEPSGQASTIQYDGAQAREAMEAVPEVQGLVARASSAIRRESGGALGDDLKRVIDVIAPLKVLPKVVTIEALRFIRAVEEGASSTHDGAGLIDSLAMLEHPDVAAQGDRAKFDAINRFVQVVLEDESVRIEVPHHRQTLYVHRDGLVLPLEHLGTGIHEVVILAAAATLLDGCLVCIEEPEVHLHPVLQRKLLRYLAEETTNRYLIATHSAHMLDSEIASIFHVTHADGRSRISLAAEPKDQAAICADLGYRPSDLVQANAVVWVEGPSDRIYLRHWLSLIDPGLVEGVHYSVMFYGGRLLSHLTADDPDVEDFISLRRLNRHVSILIDSDRQSSRQRINATKQRVVAEVGKGSGVSWVTKGYTIENYVPHALLGDAVVARHPKATFIAPKDQFSNPIESGWDKVGIARGVAERWTVDTEWPLDLKAQASAVAASIREANGLPSRSS